MTARPPILLGSVYFTPTRAFVRPLLRRTSISSPGSGGKPWWISSSFSRAPFLSVTHMRYGIGVTLHFARLGGRLVQCSWAMASVHAEPMVAMQSMSLRACHSQFGRTGCRRVELSSLWRSRYSLSGSAMLSWRLTARGETFEALRRHGG